MNSLLRKPKLETATKLEVFKAKKADLFDRVELDASDKVMFDPALQKMVESAARKAVNQMMPTTIEAPPQIIKETRVEVQKPDARLDEVLAALKKATAKIEELEKKLADTDQAARNPIIMPGGAGVIGIPPPEAAPTGYVLTVDANRKASWKVATGGSGGGAPSISGYTVSNPVTLKTLDVADLSLDELAQVVGTLITELQA